MAIMSVDELVSIFRYTVIALVRHPGPDMTARQLGLLLTCYLEATAQTVRGLAAELHVSKPAITRALDRLAEFDLVRRVQDPSDRRSVLVQRTPKGNAFLRDITKILADGASEAAKKSSVSPRRTSREAPISGRRA